MTIKKTFIFSLLLLLLLLLLAGCSPVPVTSPDKENHIEDEVSADPDTSEEPLESLTGLPPNELGRVMVLMYHEVGETESTWARHYENFRNDMETLYYKGYRPVNLGDYLQGNIDIPAGTTPFILTFDDGTAGQFRFFTNGEEPEIDPNSAVAILLDMKNKYEDFSIAGTFYIYYPVPFRQSAFIEKKLNMLVDLGFEIGNHTYGHENLANISVDEGKKTLARHVKRTAEYVPGYRVSTLALPYGARPGSDSHLKAGEWEGISYRNEAILLVGANPAFSVFDTRFDPYRLPRIRADETELTKWLNYFSKNPGARYVSDGKVSTIAVPSEYADRVVENHLTDEKELIILDP